MPFPLLMPASPLRHGSWITDDGEEPALTPPRLSGFKFISGSVGVFKGRVSHSLPMELAREMDILIIAEHLLGVA